MLRLDIQALGRAEAEQACQVERNNGHSCEGQKYLQSICLLGIIDRSR